MLGTRKTGSFSWMILKSVNTPVRPSYVLPKITKRKAISPSKSFIIFPGYILMEKSDLHLNNTRHYFTLLQSLLVHFTPFQHSHHL